MSRNQSVLQKQVVLVPFPFSDLQGAKFRPVIVMSNNTYNAKFRDFIAIPLTSNPNSRDHTIPITSKDMATGSLPLASLAKVDKIFSLEQSLVRRTFGQVRQDVFDNVRSELFRLVS
jgi:mRNA interferase MazF